MSSDLPYPIVSTDEAIALLQRGGVGVMPTDTVYGLVARANDPQATARLYALKNRHRKPGTIIAANTQQLVNLGADKAHLDKVKQWWPGPLSVILVLGKEFSYLDQGVGDVATRVVADEKVRIVLEQTGPLLTSSANHPTKPGAVNIHEAWNYFKTAVDFYVDGGDLSGRAPSTIVRLSDTGTIEILRQGAVKI